MNNNYLLNKIALPSEYVYDNHLEQESFVLNDKPVGITDSYNTLLLLYYSTLQLFLPSILNNKL